MLALAAQARRGAMMPETGPSVAAMPMAHRAGLRARARLGRSLLAPAGLPPRARIGIAGAREGGAAPGRALPLAPAPPAPCHRPCRGGP